MVEEKYNGTEVNNSGSIAPVNILHYYGDRRTKSLTKPFFLNCVHFDPRGNSPAGDYVCIPVMKPEFS